MTPCHGFFAGQRGGERVVEERAVAMPLCLERAQCSDRLGCMSRGQVFEVEGSSFRAQGLVFDYGLGFEVWGLSLKFWGLGLGFGV